ncbi:10257_t:CDS:2, partial [Funneliformis caledonium]
DNSLRLCFLSKDSLEDRSGSFVLLRIEEVKRSFFLRIEDKSSLGVLRISLGIGADLSFFLQIGDKSSLKALWISLGFLGFL